MKDYAAQEGNWLNKQLVQSSGDWKIAFGHHPYISNGTHGNAGNYDKSVPGGLQLDKTSGKIFKDFMEDYVCDKVDLYLSGDDHNLQALRPVMPCGKTEFVVSGAGSKANGFEKPGDNVNYLQVDREEGGWLVLLSYQRACLVNDGLHHEFHDGKLSDIWPTKLAAET